MPMLASYEFILRDGEVLRGATLYSELRREEYQPDFPGSDIRCDLERVEVIATSDERFMPKIFWSDEVFGESGDAALLTGDRQDPLDIGLIQIREDQVWIIRSEPTIDDRIGISVFNDRGKVLFTGVGDLTPVEYSPLRHGLPPKKGHVLTFTFHEVFKWRRSSPMECGHTSGSNRVNSPAAYPDYSAPDGGTRIP
jgi:hypothetical protein